MRLLLCHNYYQQAGGEDACFADEGALLEQHGHTVFRYEKNNDDIKGVQAVATAAHAIWNYQTYRDIRRLIRKHQIDLVHCTNTFPVISPSVYYACNRERVPVVQSLHNYRLACANAYLLRDGRVCEDCLGRTFGISAVRHGCYRESRLASLAVVALQTVHSLAATWQNRVDQFIALTDFGRDLFVRHGLAKDRLFVKPNFVDPIPEPGSGAGNYALFVGRLSPEKGIDLLLEAWRDERTRLPLRIVGDGPMIDAVTSAAESNRLIQVMGKLSPSDVRAQMQGARFLVVPSLWYEGLPRTIVESLAVGTPVVASHLGPLADLVRPEGGGVPFQTGKVDALVNAVNRLAASHEVSSALRTLARAEFELKYTADVNYKLLMEVYAKAHQVSVKRHAQD